MQTQHHFLLPGHTDVRTGTHRHRPTCHHGQFPQRHLCRQEPHCHRPGCPVLVPRQCGPRLCHHGHVPVAGGWHLCCRQFLLDTAGLLCRHRRQPAHNRLGSRSYRYGYGEDTLRVLLEAFQPLGTAWFRDRCDSVHAA